MVAGGGQDLFAAHRGGALSYFFTPRLQSRPANDVYLGSLQPYLRGLISMHARFCSVSACSISLR